VRAAPFLTALVALALVGAACRPKAGGSCREDLKGVCGDRSTMLRCEGRTYVAIPCPGPNGCRSDGETVHCDESVGSLGDTCSSDDGALACSADGKDLLVCIDHTLVHSASCTTAPCTHYDSSMVFCPGSVAKAADPCGADGFGACSADGKTRVAPS
jgi:hypothetical protein